MTQKKKTRTSRQLRIITCMDCGEPVLTSSTALRCPSCIQVKHRAAARQYYLDVKNGIRHPKRTPRKNGSVAARRYRTPNYEEHKRATAEEYGPTAHWKALQARREAAQERLETAE